MASNRFYVGICVRITMLILTLAALVWMIEHTQWYVSIGLFVIASLAQVTMLMHFATQSSRELARFLEAISFDDTSLSFSRLRSDSAHHELGLAMTVVLDRLRIGRAEREQQAQYLKTLIAHVPVALVAVDERGGVQLLNMAARRLFENACLEIGQLARYGMAFATGMEVLEPGNSVILRMERTSGTLQLKAAATDFSLRGVRHRLVSLQNIEVELSAQELVAWQTVIRVMAHEVLNSLTPVSSLAGTARDLVNDALKQSPLDAPHLGALTEASEALETMVRRSEGLLHFVQNHRRLTKRLVAQVEMVSIRRLFARLCRLLAGDLAARDIQLITTVEPETLEIAIDAELLDQALINLVRNAIDALGDASSGRIMLSARRDADGRAIIEVADNGPGIGAEQLEKVFVPFFTTKRQGSGVGLTLVRQIATVHGATVGISQTPGGGATVSLRF